MTTWTETPAGSGLMVLAEDAESDVCPNAWERSFARADIATRVILEVDVPADEDQPPPVIADDPQGKILYGIEPYERRDLWTLSQDVVKQNAGRILATRNARISMPRVRNVTINAERTDPDSTDRAIDLLTLLDIHTPSRYRGRLVNDRGLVFDNNFFAVGVTHDISAEAWTAEISLDRSTPYEVLDPIDYVWDTGRWDRSLWN